jgi:phosphoglucosamine mutase
MYVCKYLDIYPRISSAVFLPEVNLNFQAMLLKSINMQLFGSSGVRRLVNAELMDLSLKIGMVTGSLYKNVVVGRDTRTSGSALRHSVMAGLLSSGARASDAGVLPTPTLAFVTREFEAGIMITASHNPPQYNGLKLLNPDGSAFSPDQQKQVEELVASVWPLNIAWDKMRTGDNYATAIERHIGRINQEFPGGLKLKVIVDSNCGAAYFITAHLLTQLGCEVISLYSYPNGIFPHDAEPVEANLRELMAAVKESRADLGIAHDGDADRMMAIDDLGRFISGDKMLAILAQASGTRNLVTTIDASMAIEEIGLSVKRTRVGDPYVSAQLKTWGGFGGEPSGAWVFPRISLCPDGIFAAAQIVDIASKQKLSILADSLPAYPVVRGSISGAVSSMAGLKEKLVTELKPMSADAVDGIKLNFNDGWLLVRSSGTEPKIRLTAEARSETYARKLYSEGTKIVVECLQGGTL